MFRLPELNLAQCSLAETTPACTAPSTRARNRMSPRRLKTRTTSPSTIFPRPGIGRIHFQQTGFFHLLNHRHIAKSGIQEVVRFASQKLQRKLAGLLEPCRDSSGGVKATTGSSPCALRSSLVEFSFTTRRTEITLSKRQEIRELRTVI